MSRGRVFLLSPAYCGGVRGRMLMNREGSFPLAQQVGGLDGSPIGEVFSFVSGLYFRGKLAYARQFSGDRGVLVITPTRGLLPSDTRVTRKTLREFARVDISEQDARFRIPLERDALSLAASAPDDDVVLLGSVATGKYVDVLTGVFGKRLLFPVEFVGRGDMSRGGLMLRCAREGRELTYAPVAGAIRHGPRPPRLEPLR